MNARPQILEPVDDDDEDLPPEILRVIEALAKAQARADYAARFPPPEAAECRSTRKP